MQNDHPFQYIRPHSLGSRINVTTSSVSYTLPLMDDGTFPRFCRIMVEPNATGNGAFAYVNFGTTGAVTAQAGNILVTSNEQLIIQTRGYQYMAVFHPSTTANLGLLPLENC
jgi:hypothetical protein